MLGPPAVAAAGLAASWLLPAVIWPKTNFRGRTVLVIGPVCYALLLLRFELVVLAAAAAGWADDRYGDASARGFRGHLRALRRGRLTTGGLKLLVVVGVAVATLGPLDGLFVAATANLVNLFDVRPGRALKVVLLPALFVAADAATDYAAMVAATAAGLLPADLRERTMLGDTGANAIGAALGVAWVGGLRTAEVVASLLVVLVLTAMSEVVSFSAAIARIPPLRWLDGLGRAA